LGVDFFEFFVDAVEVLSGRELPQVAGTPVV